MNARRRAAAAGIVACAALALAACQSASTGALAPPKAAPTAPGVEAVLMPKNGSAAQGDAKFTQSGDRLVVLVSLNNLISGPYRIVIHERGNCSSPNAFSAGRAWAPAGDPRPATELIPVIAVGAQAHAQLSARLNGVRLAGPDSLEGRAVLVHEGATAEPNLVPDVPNRVVLCGVIGPIRSFKEMFD